MTKLFGVLLFIFGLALTSPAQVVVSGGLTMGGGVTLPVGGAPITGGGGGGGPISNHVMVVMLENRSNANAANYMTYAASLQKSYSNASSTYSAAHGSWLAYGELSSGIAPVFANKNWTADGGICTGDGCSATISIPNLVSQFTTDGKTWKGYFQGLSPQSGWNIYPGENSYVRRHNPFAFYSEVVNSSTEQANMVIDTQLATDITNHTLPNYTWLVPDVWNDAHNPVSSCLNSSGAVLSQCSAQPQCKVSGTWNLDCVGLSNADAYLKANLPTVLNSSYFQPGGDGVMIITFDESELSGDNACSPSVSQGCGGHIFTAFIGPNVKTGYSSTTNYQQRDILATTCWLLGLSACPGDGATGTPMKEFFNVTSGGGGGGGGSNVVTFADIQTQTGWGSCTGPGNNTSPSCPGGPGVATFNATPTSDNTYTLDGKAYRITSTGQTGYQSNVLWWKHEGAHNVDNTFVWTHHIYYNGTVQPNALEYDQFQFVSTLNYMMGTQCNFAAGKWDVWNSADTGGGWVHTTIPCTISTFGQSTWHTLILTTKTNTPSKKYSFVSLSIDGTVYDLSGYGPYSPHSTASWGDNSGAQYQIDISSAGGNVTEWIDESTLVLSTQ